MTNLAWTFNYHEHGDDSQERWAFISLVSPLLSQGFDHVLEATNRGERATITVQINGIEVSAKGLFDSLFMNYEHAVSRRVAEVIAALGVDSMHEALDDVLTGVREVLRDRAAAIGVKLPDQEDW